MTSIICRVTSNLANKENDNGRLIGRIKKGTGELADKITVQVIGIGVPISLGVV